MTHGADDGGVSPPPRERDVSAGPVTRGQVLRRRSDAERRVRDLLLIPDLDLVVVAAWMAAAVAAIALQVPPVVRLPAALPAALLLPGYAIGAVLFAPGVLDAAERAALAFSVSLALIVVATPILNLTPAGLTPDAVVAFTSVVTWASAALSWWRRRRPGPGSLRARQARPSPATVRVRPGLLLGAAAAAVLAGLLGVRLTAAPAASTELYVVGLSGVITDVPGTVVAGSIVTVTVGLVAHDAPAQRFRIAVLTGATTLAEFDEIVLDPGASWTEAVRFRLATPGPGQVVRVELRRGTETAPYRALQLTFNVLPAGRSSTPSPGPSGSGAASASPES